MIDENSTQDYIYVTKAERLILQTLRELRPFSQMKLRRHSTNANAFYIDIDVDETLKYSEQTLMKVLRETSDVEEVKIKSKERRGNTWDIQITRSQSRLVQ